MQLYGSEEEDRSGCDTHTLVSRSPLVWVFLMGFLNITKIYIALHYIYLADLLSKMAYNKCIQPCGYKPKNYKNHATTSSDTLNYFKHFIISPDSSFNVNLI